MTTLDRNSFLAGKLREFYESPPVSTEILEAANALDALSSLPAQAVGVKRDLPPLDAQMGSLGDRPPDPPALNAHIVPVVRVAPSQPAAVAVTDEMVERAARAMEPMAFREEYTATDEMYGFEQEGRAQALGRARAALEAALRSTP